MCQWAQKLVVLLEIDDSCTAGIWWMVTLPRSGQPRQCLSPRQIISCGRCARPAVANQHVSNIYSSAHVPLPVIPRRADAGRIQAAALCAEAHAALELGGDPCGTPAAVQPAAGAGGGASIHTMGRHSPLRAAADRRMRPSLSEAGAGQLHLEGANQGLDEHQRRVRLHPQAHAPHGVAWLP